MVLRNDVQNPDTARKAAKWRNLVSGMTDSAARSRSTLSPEATRLQAAETLAGLGRGAADDDAFRLLSKAAAAADPVAAELVDCAAEWQVECLRAQEPKLLSETPHIAFWQGFLSPFECAYVLAVARAGLRRSEIREHRIESQMESGIHVSQTAWWRPTEMDPVLGAIFKKIVRAFGGRVELAEPMSVVRYQVGDKFMAHVDAHRDYATDETEEIVRATTSIVYLNEGYEGGDTAFLSPNLKVAGRRGDLLHFRNLTSSGEVDQTSVHAGMPVTSGEKWVLVQWVRGGSK